MTKILKTQSLKIKIKNSIFNKLTPNSKLSLRVGVLYKGKKVFSECYGKKYDYYDLASLTKAIFIATYFHENSKLLNTKISSVLNWLYMSKITVKNLLNHSSGLNTHKALYKVLEYLPEDEKNFELRKNLRNEVESIKKRKNNIAYSDLGFLILGFFIQELENESLDVVFKNMNKVKGLHFNLCNKPKFKKNLYAPTKICTWRKRILQGEVFDDNAHVMGGVAPQAGLFGSIQDMLEYGKKLRLQYKKQPKFFKKINNEWANGFMIPSGEKTTAGTLFSKNSIGHLGYTGTSFWYDPIKDLFIVILSNKTLLDKMNTNFNQCRSMIQDLVYKEFI